MATSENSEKKVSIDLTQLAIILVLLVAGVFMGFKMNRLGKSNDELSKKERQRIEENAVLKASKDSLLSDNLILTKTIKLLQADVTSANSSTMSSELILRAYKQQYAKLRDSIHLDTNNCPTLLLGCEEMNKRHEDYELVLLANIRSYKVYSDTLVVKLNNSESVVLLLEKMNKNKDEELLLARKKVKRRGILNYGLVGLTAGMAVVLIAQ